ncbi:MAG: hypothetical protein J6D08_15165 [Lachnospiraceae bacterium]|nr:hypothetical protein [Lachnospiraceae bacterium]
MVEKDDWRLLKDVDYLKKAKINPTDGQEIFKHAPYLKRCEFCLEPMQNDSNQWWFIPHDLSCCICEKCYKDFHDDFEWEKLDGWDIEWRLERSGRKGAGDSSSAETACRYMGKEI